MVCLCLPWPMYCVCLSICLVKCVNGHAVVCHRFGLFFFLGLLSSSYCCLRLCVIFCMFIRFFTLIYDTLTHLQSWHWTATAAAPSVGQVARMLLGAPSDLASALGVLMARLVLGGRSGARAEVGRAQRSPTVGRGVAGVAARERAPTARSRRAVTRRRRRLQSHVAQRPSRQTERSISSSSRTKS